MKLPGGGEPLVHVDPATRMGSGVFGGVDADARQEAGEIVRSSGEDRHQLLVLERAVVEKVEEVGRGFADKDECLLFVVRIVAPSSTA